MLVPHRRRELHPENRGGIFPNYLCCGIKTPDAMGALMVALVEGRVSGVPDEVMAEVGLVIKGEVEGIVVNSLVGDSVFELEVVVEGAVGPGGGIGRFLEGKCVKFLD
uniref:Uncharacterized protein n=1 Tax=Opuntia streptacantha TaxID=393608 RepID=A0A7C8ZK09_OPUST